MDEKQASWVSQCLFWTDRLSSPSFLANLLLIGCARALLGYLLTFPSEFSFPFTSFPPFIHFLHVLLFLHVAFFLSLYFFYLFYFIYIFIHLFIYWLCYIFTGASACWKRVVWALLHPSALTQPIRIQSQCNSTQSQLMPLQLWPASVIPTTQVMTTLRRSKTMTTRARGLYPAPQIPARIQQNPQEWNLAGGPAKIGILETLNSAGIGPFRNWYWNGFQNALEQNPAEWVKN